MIEINRTFNYETGLREVENLSGVTFSAESFAHTFNITRTDGDVWPGTITARFIRADGVTVFIEGSIDTATWKTASVTLSPECYAAPGPFLLVLFNVCEDIDQAVAVYAARGTVLASDSGTVIASSGTMQGIEAQLRAIMEYCFADSNSLAELMARYAVNISNMEGELAGFLTQSNEIMDALADSGISILSAPNMLDPHAFYYTATVQVDGVDTTVERVYGQTNRCAAYGKAYMKNATNSYGTDNTDPDEISEAVTTLSPTITDGDGSVYRKGVAFTVTNPPANGYMNADILYYLYGNHGEGEVPVSESGNHDLDLKVGHVYTMSCWARVTSGETMMLEFAYSPVPYWMPGERKIIEVSGSAWRRVEWQFTFNPTGNQFNDYTVYTDGNGHYSTTQDETYTTAVTRRQAMWTKTVGFGVCRKYAGTVELCGFRLVEGNNYAKNRFDDIEEDISAALSSIAPVESGATASTNYASGALVMWKGKLYKTSAAVATGATWAVGTNLTATTLAAELAALAT